MAEIGYIKFPFIAFIIFTLLTPMFDAQSVVTIDSKNRLIVDGTPFFPNGIYSFKVPTEKYGLDRIAEAHFNFILPYQEENIKPYYPYGLKIIYGPTLWYTGMPWRVDWNERVMNYVEKEKNKSSLIGWYINDELDWVSGFCLINKTHKPNYFICSNSVVGGCNPSASGNCTCSMDGAYLFSSCLRHTKIKQTDPNHPCIAVLMGYNNPEFWEPFKDCTDILGVDVYPNHRKNCMGIYNDTIRFHELADNKKPVWIVMQLCRYRNDKEIKAWNQGCKPTDPYYPYCLSDPNFPLLNEIRIQAYLALIAKADGLIWWIYEYMNTKWTSGDNITLRWSNVTQMGKEVQFMSPMLLGGDDYDLQASNTTILTRGLLYNGSSYILVANPKGVQKSVVIKPKTDNWDMKDVTVKYGNLSVAEKGSLLQIMAPPYESGLIIVEPKETPGFGILVALLCIIAAARIFRRGARI